MGPVELRSIGPFFEEKRKMRIHITCSHPENEVLSFAAGELEAYLERMLPQDGADLTAALRAGDDPDGRETFAVAMAESGGSITGSCPRAVLLGVYDYLRRLGCRFLGPGEQWEVVPAVGREKLAADYEKRASFPHRGVCIEGADSRENVLEFIDWLPKAGYNSFFLQFKTPYAFLKRWYHHENNPLREPEPYGGADAERDMAVFQRELKRRGLLLHKVGHGWTGEVLGYEALSWDADPAPLAADRRELAAEVGGVRGLWQGVPANTNLCFSNPRAGDALASLVEDYARKNPDADYIHVWLADTFNNVCACENCQKTTLSDQYAAVLNEIDRRLRLAGLGTRIVFLLYQELLWPPVKERLNHPDRFVLMFAPISRTFEASYALDGPEKPIPAYVRNQITLPTDLGENLAFLRGWQRIFDGDSFVYDYPLGRAHYGDLGYVHIARVIGSDVKKLPQMGLDGYVSCQELRAALPNALPNYVMGYTLLDEGADTEALIREYFQAAYGEDWERVLAYLSELSRLSSCDYLNGKGERTDPDIARRMAALQEVCRSFAPVLDAHQGAGLYWELLAYHRRYAMGLARAMELLALGRRRESLAAWRTLCGLICENEPKYQPYLDVYRVREVTANYTGFRELEA